jgi:DNA-binding NarL/FixJ family response regulator
LSRRHKKATFSGGDFQSTMRTNQISDTKKKVLGYLKKGLTKSQIAKKCKVNVRTIQRYKADLRAKNILKKDAQKIRCGETQAFAWPAVQY